MKKQIILNTIISSGLLFASMGVYSSDLNNSTDLIYGIDVTVPSPSEPFIARPSMTNNQATDLIYGEYQPPSSPSQQPDLFTYNANNNTDLIYRLVYDD